MNIHHSPIIDHHPPKRSSDEWEVWGIIEKKEQKKAANELNKSNPNNDHSNRMITKHGGKCQLSGVRFIFLNLNSPNFSPCPVRLPLWISPFYLSSSYQSCCLGLQLQRLSTSSKCSRDCPTFTIRLYDFCCRCRYRFFGE